MSNTFKIHAIAALIELGFSFNDVLECRTRQCASRIERVVGEAGFEPNDLLHPKVIFQANFRFTKVGKKKKKPKHRSNYQKSQVITLEISNSRLRFL